MKRKIIILVAIFFFTVSISGCTRFNSNKPPIVEFNTCAQSCEGDRSKYIVKVYEGVTTKSECDTFNGVLKQVDNEDAYCQVK